MYMKIHARREKGLQKFYRLLGLFFKAFSIQAIKKTVWVMRFYIHTYINNDPGRHILELLTIETHKQLLHQLQQAIKKSKTASCKTHINPM